MDVKKSDGTFEEYSAEKIKRGICAAYDSCSEVCPDGLIEALIKNLFVYNNIQSNEIRRQVEEALMSINKKVAKEYIKDFKEREDKDLTLKNRDDFIQNYIKSMNAATGSTYDANANVCNKNAATLNAEIPKGQHVEFNRYSVKNKLTHLYSKKIGNRYIQDLENHIIYKHDESSFGINIPYCAAIQSHPFITDGLKGLGGLSSRPKGLSSFCGLFCNLIFAVSSQFAGAIAFSNFFGCFSYFAIKEWGRDYYLHPDRIARFKYSESGQDMIPITIDRQIEDYFQQVVYTINQPAAARGFQSSFTNFGYFDKAYFEGMYGEFTYPDGTKPNWDSVSYLQKKFMKWFNKEREKCVLTFPVETMSLLYQNGEFVDKEYADFTAEMYAEGHSFFTYISDSPDTLSSCCRLKSNIDKNHFFTTNGMVGESTGSKSVITLNYNRIIQNFVKDSFEDKNYFDNRDEFKLKFKEYLIEILERVYKYHTAYNEILWDLHEHGILQVYSAGFIHLNQQYLTLGINGLNEAWMFLGGQCRYNDDYRDFCNFILTVMREQNSLHRAKKLMFNTEFVPAESLGAKNWKWDKHDGYWVPEGRNVYTSYFFLPDDPDVSVIEKLQLHSREFVENLDGGQACHINLDDHLSKEQYAYLLNLSGELGTNYITFNVKNTECRNCGYISKKTLTKCPKCESENLDYYTRIIGYLVKVASFNEARQIEEKQRVYGGQTI
jgi:ribonucleoside-triphosphate reductase